MPKRPAARSRMIPQLLRALRTLGADVEALLAASGLPHGAERLDDVSLAPEQFEALLGHAAAALDDPLLALRLPELLDAPSYHIGELAARASPTLSAAFARVARFGSLFYAHVVFGTEEVAGELRVTQRLRGGAAPGDHFANEFGVASMLAHARRVVGRPIVPIRAWFSHAPRPAREAEAMRALLGLPRGGLSFQRADSGLAFPAEHGALPSLAHDRRLLATADELAERALREEPPAVDLVARIEAQVRQELQRGEVSAAAVARRLRMSPRTLQRRLDDEGTSFRALCERVRQDLARALLADPAVPLAEVAYRLGFSEPGAFGRAFKRWTGSSPGAFRRQLG